MTRTLIEDPDWSVTPIGEWDGEDPYTAEHGAWDSDQLVNLIEVVLALHRAVWPDGEIDGDDDPAELVLWQGEWAVQQVTKLRQLADEVNKRPKMLLTPPELEMIHDLDDYGVLARWRDHEGLAGTRQLDPDDPEGA